MAELRVASRVVPLEDIFELKGLLRKGAFASVSGDERGERARKTQQSVTAWYPIRRTRMCAGKYFVCVVGGGVQVQPS